MQYNPRIVALLLLCQLTTSLYLLRIGCMSLTSDLGQMCAVSEQDESSACGHCLGLVGGILGVMISVIWILHISLYMLPSEPISGMLNEALIYLDENVSHWITESYISAPSCVTGSLCVSTSLHQCTTVCPCTTSS